MVVNSKYLALEASKAVKNRDFSKGYELYTRASDCAIGVGMRVYYAKQAKRLAKFSIKSTT